MRAVKLFLALLLFAVGAGLIAVGIGGIQTFGSEGRLNLESPVLESGSPSYALVIDVADVDTGLPYSDKLGETTIGARSTDQGSLFVGLAATPDLDDYLRGVPYDVVRNEGAGWELSTVPGTQKPDSPRAEQFWTRRGTGSEPTIPFTQAPGGKTTFVTMNSVGGSGVAAVMTVGYRSSVVFPLSVGSITLGIVLILLALFLALRSRKKRKRAGTSEEPPSIPAPASGSSISGSTTGTEGALATGGGPSTGPVGLPPERESSGAGVPSESQSETTASEVPEATTSEQDESGGHSRDDEGAGIPDTTGDPGPVTSTEEDAIGKNPSEHTPGNDGPADENATGGKAANEPNESRHASNTAKVDSDSSDTADYDSWFRDGKTK